MSDLVERAEAALRRLDATAALALYDGPTNGIPEDQVLSGLVRALWLLRRWAAARETCAVLEGEFPDSVHTAIARGVIALGQPDEPALIGLENSSANRDDLAAIESFEEAVRLDSTSDVAVAGLATALRVAGRMDDAEAVLADYLDAPEPSNEILFARAAIAIDRDHIDEAREYLDRVIAADPIDHRAIHCYVDLDWVRWSHLLDDLVAEGAPAVASLLEHRAWLNVKAGSRSEGAERKRLLDAADAGFAASIETGPPIPGAFHGRAYVADLCGNRVRSQEFIAQGLAVENDSGQLKLKQALFIDNPRKRYEKLCELLAEASREIARIPLAFALNRLGRPGEARSLIADLTEELPDHRDLIRANAWFDVLDGYPERALAEFRRLRRANPNVIAGELAALRMLNAIEQAEALYDEIIAQKSVGSSTGMKLEFAYCAMHEGRYEQAEERAHAVLADGPNDADAKKLRKAAHRRAARRWWRPDLDEARALGLAGTDRVKARLRAEFIPEAVRERTFGRLRALEWELAKLRAGEEKAISRRSRLTEFFGLLTLLAVLAGPWWVSELFGYAGFNGWRWLIVDVAAGGVAVWWTAVSFARGRVLLGSAPLLAGAVTYLWWRSWHLIGFWDMAFLAGVVVPVVLMGASNLLDMSMGINTGGPVRRGRWRRRQGSLRRRYPFASMLLDLEELAILLGDENAMAAGAARERCVRLFESVAVAADHVIRRARTEHFEDESRPAAWLYQPKPYWVRAWLRPLAGYPDALLEQRLNRCAASVVTLLRQYKRQVLLPGDGTWARLRQDVIKFAALACERRWDSLPQPEPEKAASRLRAWLAVSVRLFLTAAVGPAALVAYEVLPGTRPPVPALVAIALYAGWPLLTIMIRVDPDFLTKLNVLGSWLPGAGRPGDQDQQGAAAPSASGKK